MLVLSVDLRSNYSMHELAESLGITLQPDSDDARQVIWG
ncbi:MAG: hypothetical protein ACI97K_003185 [Glaciecola sp.]|jgi:hypothetical protein